MMPPERNDLCVRVFAPRRTSGDATNSTTTRTYPVGIYTLGPTDLGGDRFRGMPEEWLGMPLRGSGRLMLSWGTYQDYLANFFEGDKGPREMRGRLNSALSDELRKLVEIVRQTSDPLRVWWLNDAPELDDMPWDLLFYDPPQAAPPRFTFVRGAPPQLPPPVIPVDGPLRLVWNDAFAPSWLVDVFAAPPPGIVPVRVQGSVREAIRRAVSEGCELLHACSDGIVSLAYEGVLYDHGHTTSPHVTANDLSSALASSRVAVLGLTVQDYADPDTIELRGRDVPAAYRAFACLSSARIPLPSIVAPVGPTMPDIARTFWREFYMHLGGSHRLDIAQGQARHAAPSSPFALFMRHARGRVFRATTTQQRTAPPSPERLTVDLRTSRDATSNLMALNEQYGHLPGYLSEFVKHEDDRQKSIEATLDEWSQPEGDER